MKHFPALLLLAACSCSAPKAVDAGMVVHFDAASGRCVFESNGHAIPFGSTQEDLGNVEKAAKAWPGDTVMVKSTTDTPYKCIGAAVFTLQRAKKRVSFVAQPPDDGPK